VGHHNTGHRKEI